MSVLRTVLRKRIGLSLLGITAVFVGGLFLGLSFSGEYTDGFQEVTALAQRDAVFEALRMVDYACYFVSEAEDGSLPFSGEIMHINPLIKDERIHVAGFAGLQLFCTPVIKSDKDLVEQFILAELGFLDALSRLDYACYPLDPAGPAEFPYDDRFTFAHVNPALEDLKDVVKLGNVNLFCSPVEKFR